MAAMMVPSAVPLIHRFAADSHGRRNWELATGLLTVIYLLIWLGFGIACYVLYIAVGMPSRNPTVVGAVAIGLAAVYGLTPLKRAAQARCRELCALHEPLPFNLLQGAAVVGFRYGVTCVGCNAFLMGVMLVPGMSNLVWALLVSLLAVLYRFLPAPSRRYELTVALALAALAGAYLLTA
jgi:predicted metal-binding membrane protein